MRIQLLPGPVPSIVMVLVILVTWWFTGSVLFLDGRSSCFPVNSCFRYLAELTFGYEDVECEDEAIVEKKKDE